MKVDKRKRIVAFASLTFIALAVGGVGAWRSLVISDAVIRSNQEERNADQSTMLMSEHVSPQQPSTSELNESSLRVLAPYQSVEMYEHLPPVGTPWRQVFTALMDRAQAGGKAASDRLYDDTFGCIQYNFVLGSARELLRTKSDVSKMSAGQVIHELDSYETMQSILRENEATCSTVTREELFAQMYPILLAAARNGNKNAAACYAFGSYEPPATSGNKNEFALQEWERNSTEFMQAGVRRGDWKMVILMRTYSDPATQEFATISSSGWAAQQFQPDPLVAYQYAALRAIGAKNYGDEAAQERTSELVSGYRESYDISDTQVRDAEQWAQETYQQYFAGRPWVAVNDVNWCAHGD